MVNFMRTSFSRPLNPENLETRNCRFRDRPIQSVTIPVICTVLVALVPNKRVRSFFFSLISFSRSRSFFQGDINAREAGRGTE